MIFSYCLGSESYFFFREGRGYFYGVVKWDDSWDIILLDLCFGECYGVFFLEEDFLVLVGFKFREVDVVIVFCG